MPKTVIHYSRAGRSGLPRLYFSVLAIAGIGGTLAVVARGQEATVPGQILENADEESATASSESPQVQQTLKFNFRHAAWEDVLEWIADEAGLSLSKDVIPKSTFNYVDQDQTYTVREAMDLINKWLLIRGYTLLRSGKTLLVLDFENNIDQELVRELLTETPEAELDQRGEYEMTKTTFVLESPLFADQAEAEKLLQPLLSAFGSVVVMPQANEIIATDTGGTLRRIQGILRKVEGGAKNKLHVFRLKSVDANEVLMAARPLVGLAIDANAAEDGSIRLSSNPTGTMVFAAGTAEKVKLVKELVDELEGVAADPLLAEDPQLIVHRLKTAQPDVVLRVLQTLFQGDPVVRLEPDATSGGILAYARPNQHLTIRAAIGELEQNTDRLEVIPLQYNDPGVVALLLTNIFSKYQNPPIVDGTLDPPQLIVRGSDAQITQIRDMLGKMGEQFGRSALAGAALGNVRVFQMDPEAARALAEQIEQVWPSLSDHPITVVRPSASSPAVRTLQLGPSPVVEGTADRSPPALGEQGQINRDSDAGASIEGIRQRPPERKPESPPRRDRTALLDAPIMPSMGSPIHLVSSQIPAEESAEASDGQTPAETVANAESTDRAIEPVQQPADIVVIQTPSGLVVRSEDQQALASIESLLQMFAGQADTGGTRFHLFYLTHVEAETASQLLSSLMTGLATSSTGSTGSVGGTLSGSSPGGSSLSSSSLASSSPKIVADKRLNALFVQGSSSQITMVKQLLEFIDIESGPEEVLTFPRPRFIPVYYTSAEVVAEVVKEIYVSRLDTGPQNKGNNRGNGRGGGDRFGGFGGGFGGFRGRGGDDSGGQVTQEVASAQAKMTVAVDTTSNMVVVSAPGPLLNEVEAVIREIDGRAAQTPAPAVSVVTLKHGNAASIKDTLVNVLGDQVQSSATSSGGRSSTFGRNGSSRDTSRTTQVVPFGGGFGRGGFGGGNFGGGGRGRGGSTDGGGGRGGR